MDLQARSTKSPEIWVNETHSSHRQPEVRWGNARARYSQFGRLNLAAIPPRAPVGGSLEAGVSSCAVYRLPCITCPPLSAPGP